MNIQNVESSGICSCCKGVLTCTYTKNPCRPTWECDDFDGYEPSRASTVVKDILTTTDPEPGFDIEEKDSGKHKGLCGICEDRDICTFTKPEGGVWHCEEYR
jgi:hypothetical protein